MSERSIEIVDEIFRNQAIHGRALKKKNTRIMGYFCCLTPVEIITAAGLVPWRITGNTKRNLKEVDAHVEANACPYTRNCLDLAITGEYDFLDGIVFPHACDNIVKLYDIWKYHTKPGFSHFINIPHSVSKPSYEFLYKELQLFRKKLEGYIGRKIDNNEIEFAIKLHNENRALLRKLYELRKPDPPLISGSEIIRILVSLQKLPVKEANILLTDIITEIKNRKQKNLIKLPRIFAFGSEMDNPDLIEIIEECGANVVMDDFCIGPKLFWNDVETGGDPLMNLATRYLEKINCPRFFRGNEEDHNKDLEKRFGYLRNYAREFSAQGFIASVIKYCDIFAFDVPDATDYLKKTGLPGYVIDNDYMMIGTQIIKNRIQAFIEMISNNTNTSVRER